MHLFDTANLARLTRTWQTFIWWNSLPRHDGRVSRINNCLTRTGEYLSANLKHHVCLQVPAVRSYLQESTAWYYTQQQQ